MKKIVTAYLNTAGEYPPVRVEFYNPETKTLLVLHRINNGQDSAAYLMYSILPNGMLKDMPLSFSSKRQSSISDVLNALLNEGLTGAEGKRILTDQLSQKYENVEIKKLPTEDYGFVKITYPSQGDIKVVNGASLPVRIEQSIANERKETGDQHSAVAILARNKSGLFVYVTFPLTREGLIVSADGRFFVNANAINKPSHYLGNLENRLERADFITLERFRGERYFVYPKASDVNREDAIKWVCSEICELSGTSVATPPNLRPCADDIFKNGLLSFSYLIPEQIFRAELHEKMGKFLSHAVRMVESALGAWPEQKQDMQSSYKIISSALKTKPLQK